MSFRKVQNILNIIFVFGRFMNENEKLSQENTTKHTVCTEKLNTIKNKQTEERYNREKIIINEQMHKTKVCKRSRERKTKTIKEEHAENNRC